MGLCASQKGAVRIVPTLSGGGTGVGRNHWRESTAFQSQLGHKWQRSSKDTQRGLWDAWVLGKAPGKELRELFTLLWTQE